VDFEFTKEEKEIIREVRLFIQKEATPEVLKESHELEFIYGGTEGRKFVKKFAANGWLTPSWPKAYGGLELSEMATYMIRNEMAYAGVPFHFAGAHMAGPSILRHGTEANKKYLLPLSKGEIEFALGYTEPNAGSDLMGLEMYAEDKGDHFIVNGSKTFNTHAHVADLHWLAVRTELEGPKHKGISILIVDLNTPGITIRPIITMAGTRSNEVYYDNVSVPKENLVGEKNMGFRYIMAALDFERMFPWGHYKHLFDDLVAFTKEATVNGKPLSKDPLIRQKLAQLETEFEVLRHLYFQLAHMLDNGKVPNYQSSMEKLFFSELARRVPDAIFEIAGLATQIAESDKRTVLHGKAEYFYRWCLIETIVGGTSEIQRNIIAQRGLGMPRGA
jgi:3-oxocholest-4-en-26-oyl-CoA dehydrogenase alpha subunit